MIIHRNKKTSKRPFVKLGSAGLCLILTLLIVSVTENRLLQGIAFRNNNNNNIGHVINKYHTDFPVGDNIDVLNQKYKSVDDILDWVCWNARHNNYRKSSSSSNPSSSSSSSSLSAAEQDGRKRNVVQFTSFGPTGLVIRHMLEAKKDCHVSVPIITVDTLHLFPQSYEFLKKKQQIITPPPSSSGKSNIFIYKPKGYSTQEEFDGKYGKDLFKRDPEKYSFLTKQEPTQRALADFQTDVWITGRRRSQGGSRVSLKAFEIDTTTTTTTSVTAEGSKATRIKVNPLVDWTYDQVWEYIRSNRIEYNPLYDHGFKSIGDVRTTSKVAPDAEERSGRFQGLDQSECGMHNLSFLPSKYQDQDGSQQSQSATNNTSEKKGIMTKKQTQEDFVEVTSETIEEIVLKSKNSKRDGKDNIFLVFYHPQCGHCRHFEPTFFEIAKELGKSPSQTSSNSSNAPSPSSLENILPARFSVGKSRVPQKAKDVGLKVPGTPALYLILHKPFFQVQKYSGFRRKDSILKWLQSLTKDTENNEK